MFFGAINLICFNVFSYLISDQITLITVNIALDGTGAARPDRDGAILYAGLDALSMTGQFLTIDAGFLPGKPPTPSR